MKKHFVMVLSLIIIFLLSGCSLNKHSAQIDETITTKLITYYKMSDGTWQTDLHSYKNRIEISGRMNNAAKDSTFVYLSNRDSITFDQAWKAAGFSSNSKDYFSVEDAVLVDMR